MPLTIPWNLFSSFEAEITVCNTTVAYAYMWGILHGSYDVIEFG